MSKGGWEWVGGSRLGTVLRPAVPSPPQRDLVVQGIYLTHWHQESCHPFWGNHWAVNSGRKQFKWGSGRMGALGLLTSIQAHESLLSLSIPANPCPVSAGPASCVRADYRREGRTESLNLKDRALELKCDGHCGPPSAAGSPEAFSFFHCLTSKPSSPLFSCNLGEVTQLP